MSYLISVLKSVSSYGKVKHGHFLLRSWEAFDSVGFSVSFRPGYDCILVQWIAIYLQNAEKFASEQILKDFKATTRRKKVCAHKATVYRTLR